MPGLRGPKIVHVSDLIPRQQAAVIKEIVFPVTLDRFLDERSARNFLGQYDSDKVTKGLDFLLKSLPGKGGNNSNMGAWGGWYFYGNYYATLAMYQAKEDKYWKAWYPAIRDDLLKNQSSDGSWKNAESASYGPAFGTGFALQILQIPNRYLPIYQSGKD